MIYLQLEDEIISKYPHIQPEQLILAAETALKYQEMTSSTALTLVICENDAIQELNCQYRNVNIPTDVLSFPSEEQDPDTGELYLGDVIISIEYALTNLDGHRTTIDSELLLLVVHGILHLLGYDHSDEEEKEKMWATQTDILMQLGIDIIVQ